MFEPLLKLIGALWLVSLLFSCAKTPEEVTATDECLIITPGEPVMCTMQYDPVCGCDEKTYSNACTSRAAGVPASTAGACDDPGER